MQKIGNSGSSGNAKDYYDGTITLCEMDITYVAHLIVSGPLRGRVVYLDYDRSSAPIWPKKVQTFLIGVKIFIQNY